jgi:hypothetical protein
MVKVSDLTSKLITKTTTPFMRETVNFTEAVTTPGTTGRTTGFVKIEDNSTLDNSSSFSSIDPTQFENTVEGMKHTDFWNVKDTIFSEFNIE